MILSNHGIIQSIKRGGGSIVTDGLVLHLDAGNTASYPGSGTTWTDLSGNGNDMTLINGPTFDSGNGGSIVFDGTNDRAERNPINVGNSFTISAWVYFNNTNNLQNILSNSWSYNSLQGFSFQTYSNSSFYLSVEGDGPYRITSSNSYTANTWFNAVATYDGTTIKMYVNGIELSYSDGSSAAVTISYGPTLLYLSAQNAFGAPDWFMSGKISQIALYNRALSAAEIESNYNALKGRYGL
jgi:hypothetical protein